MVIPELQERQDETELPVEMVSLAARENQECQELLDTQEKENVDSVELTEQWVHQDLLDHQE